MPTQYCPACGAGTKYDLNIPNFCAVCGKGYSSSVASLIPQAQPAAPVTTQPARQLFQPAPPPISRNAVVARYLEERGEQQEASEAVDFRIPAKLDVVVEFDPPKEKVSLGSIMQGTQDKIVLEPGKKQSKKEREAQLQAFRTKLQTVQRHEPVGE